MDLYGLHSGIAQANAVSGEQAAYNQNIHDENIEAVKNLKTHQGQEQEQDDMKDVKDAISNTVTGYTVQKSAKGYKEANALKTAKAGAKDGMKAGAMADSDGKSMIKVLKSHKFTPDELRGGAGGQMGRRAQYLTDQERMSAAGIPADTPPEHARGILSGPTEEQEQAYQQKKNQGGASGEGETAENHPTSDSAAPKSTTDTTSLQDPAEKPASTGGGATGEVGAIEEGGEEAKTGAGSFIKKATGMGGKVADTLGKIGGGIASAGILGDEIYGEVESFKNHPGGSLWQKMSGDN